MTSAPEDVRCRLCGEEKISWHHSMLCPVCDNPSTGEGTWFAAWCEADE